MRDDVREALMERGQHVPAPEHVRALYRRAFELYETRALWSSQVWEQPTLAQVLVMTRRLRAEGNMAAWRLAGEIERACDASF